MQTCRRNKPVLQCETKAYDKYRKYEKLHATTPCCAQKKCEECLLHFHGQLQHEIMTIQDVEPQDPRTLLELYAQEMPDSLSLSMEFSNTFLFRMIFF